MDSKKNQTMNEGQNKSSTRMDSTSDLNRSSQSTQQSEKKNQAQKPGKVNQQNDDATFEKEDQERDM